MLEKSLRLGQVLDIITASSVYEGGGVFKIGKNEVFYGHFVGLLVPRINVQMKLIYEKSYENDLKSER